MNFRAAPTIVHRFGEFDFDVTTRRLFRGDVRVPLSDPQSAILACLIARAGHIVPKETLLQEGWPTQAVTDDNFLQTMSRVRRALRSGDGCVCIETVPSHGYRFTATLHRAERHDRSELPGTDAGACRACVQGRRHLHTLTRNGINQARALFEEALRSDPDYAPAHIGLANACALAFEASRFDDPCDVESVRRAVQHAQHAVRLAPSSAEAWSTLALAVCLEGDAVGSAAAAHKSVALEPGHWQGWLRLAFVTWGEDRVHAARTMLGLSPKMALGHWLIATVLIARGAFDAAIEELQHGCAAQDEQAAGPFPAVGLYLLRGLVLGAQGNLDECVDALTRELSFVNGGQVYARECAANTWYALGAIRRRQRRPADAEAAFANALRVAPSHVFTLAALGRSFADRQDDEPFAIDTRIACAARLVGAGRHRDATDVYRAAVTGAPVPWAGWILPVEPLIDAASRTDVWSDVLAIIRRRAL